METFLSHMHVFSCVSGRRRLEHLLVLSAPLTKKAQVQVYMAEAAEFSASQNANSTRAVERRLCAVRSA